MLAVAPDPSSGEADYFLISGENVGCGESDLGTDSSLVARPNDASCIIPA